LKDGAVSERTFLEEITIRSIGVIEQSNLELSKGLTVLTGETGAGKTMILTALNLILGGKSDSSLVRKGSERLVASGRFRVPPNSSLIFEESGLQVEDGELIITRTVALDGKSKATCNSIAVPASTLSSVADLLVEVHAQAANLSITKSARQRELLDRFAGTELSKAFASYKKSLEEYHDLKTRIAQLKSTLNSRDSELVALREFVTLMSKLRVERGEYSQVLVEIERLSSVEELRLAASNAHAVIDEQEQGSLTTLGITRKALDSARAKDPLLEDAYQKTSEAFFILDDVKNDLASYLSRLEADPARLDFLNARKADLVALVKKYGALPEIEPALEQLIARFENASESMEDLEGGDEKLRELESQLVDSKKRLVVAAKALTLVRQKAADAISDQVSKEMSKLSMPHASFKVQLLSADYSALRESDFTSSGCDEVSMVIQNHKDAPLVALAKGASGGEMSRVMLALEVVIASTHPVGTYVFDEVDAGVGGKAAIEVGRRLHALSKHAQVIVVTHLPQVAAWADSHYVVTKNSDGSITESNVQKVQDSARIAEIARMLSGMESSSSALEHAAELLELPLSGR
jgi:DNA repair protein RecN (Recombination protein N)